MINTSSPNTPLPKIPENHNLVPSPSKFRKSYLMAHYFSNLIWNALASIRPLAERKLSISSVAATRIAKIKKEECDELKQPIQWTDRAKVKKLKGKIFIAKIKKTKDQKQLITDRVLSTKEWSNVFEKINQYCINQPYAGASYHRLNKNTWRPNHNGTHSARQVRSFEVIYDLVSQSNQGMKLQATPEELNSLKLAAYCYRAGRVDETGMGRDQNRARSAQIYEEHAKQLGLSQNTIEWTSAIINRHYSEPLSDPRQECAYQILDIGHRLDLHRCFNRKKMKGEVEHIRKALGQWGLESHTPSLCRFAIHMIRSTGCRIKSPHYEWYNEKQFSHFSQQGGQCWEMLSKIHYH